MTKLTINTRCVVHTGDNEKKKIHYTNHYDHRMYPLKNHFFLLFLNSYLEKRKKNVKLIKIV